MCTIMITGASGFLGSELANALVQNSNNHVIGIDPRFPGFLTDETREQQNFVIHQSPLLPDRKYFSDHGTDNYIVHLASQQPTAKDLNYENYYRGNVETSLRVIDLIKRETIKAVIFISTTNVLGQQLSNKTINENMVPSPFDYYGLTKYVAEKLFEIELQKTLTKGVVIRFPSLIGKNHLGGIINTYYSLIKNGKDIDVYGNGLLYRNFLHVSDAVETIMQTINNIDNLNDFEIIHSGSSDSIPTKEIASLIKEYLLSDSEIHPIADTTSYSWDLFMDISKLQNKLGFVPRSCKNAITKYMEEMQ